MAKHAVKAATVKQQQGRLVFGQLAGQLVELAVRDVHRAGNVSGVVLTGSGARINDHDTLLQGDFRVLAHEVEIDQRLVIPFLDLDRGRVGAKGRG